MYLIEPKRHDKWIYDPGVSMAIQEYVKDNIFLDDDVLFPLNYCHCCSDVLLCWCDVPILLWSLATTLQKRECNIV